MKKIFFTRGIIVASLMFGLTVVPALFAEEKKEGKKEDKKAEAPKPKPQSVFKDKALEEGVPLLSAARLLALAHESDYPYA